MPCTDGGVPYARDVRDQEEFDKLTRLLCEANRLIERSSAIYDMRSKEMAQWWEDHKEADRKRINAELEIIQKKRQGLTQSLKKLDDDEIQRQRENLVFKLSEIDEEEKRIRAGR